MSGTNRGGFEEVFDSVCPAQINLKSFRRKPTLNPRLWKDGELKKIVRRHLASIARDFVDGLDMDGLVPEDVVLVGSSAGYNWSKYSDLDLHVIVDFSKLSRFGTPETLKKLFDLKKNAWNEKHDVLIYGYPVEVYVQDSSEENASDGVYSVKFGKWVKVPSAGDPSLDRPLIKRQAAQYINLIDRMDELSRDGSLTKKQRRILDSEADRLHDEIVGGRRSSLSAQGEYAAGNIVFKVLRRTGHLGKLRDLRARLFDQIHSV